MINNRHNTKARQKQKSQSPIDPMKVETSSPPIPPVELIREALSRTDLTDAAHAYLRNIIARSESTPEPEPTPDQEPMKVDSVDTIVSLIPPVILIREVLDRHKREGNLLRSFFRLSLRAQKERSEHWRYYGKILGEPEILDKTIAPQIPPVDVAFKALQRHKLDDKLLRILYRLSQRAQEER